MLRRAPTAAEVLAGRDLGGRVLLVTGADSGIGLETARALAGAGARVHLGCLDAESGERAAADIRRDHPGADLRVLPFDLGDLSAVRDACRRFDDDVLHGLVCNAGVYGGPYRQTADGFEYTLGVCYLGHFELFRGLVAALERGAPSRVVLVSSQNHRFPRTLDLDALPLTAETYSELGAYGLAKRALVLLAVAITDRYADRGITANALHPGDLIRTGIDKDSGTLRWVMRLASPFTRSPAQAAATSVFVATEPSLDGVGGRYFVDRREQPAAPGAQDPTLADALWARTERWLTRSGAAPPSTAGSSRSRSR